MSVFASQRMASPATGATTSDKSNSRQEISAAPARQAIIFSGSQISRPKRLSRPEETFCMSLVKRLIKSEVPSSLKVARSSRNVRR